jgi:dCMP deaminase
MKAEDIVSQFVRPSWDDWFMGLAVLISSRSLDPATKHGCVVVSHDRSILSVGYNSPPRGCNDNAIPITRPEKYLYFEHAETNAVLNAARHGIALEGADFYVTGFPCEGCVRKIVNCGGKRVIWGPVASACISDESLQVILKIKGDLEFVQFDQTTAVISLLQNAALIFDSKTKDRSIFLANVNKYF